MEPQEENNNNGVGGPQHQLSSLSASAGLSYGSANSSSGTQGFLGNGFASALSSSGANSFMAQELARAFLTSQIQTGGTVNSNALLALTQAAPGLNLSNGSFTVPRAEASAQGANHFDLFQSLRSLANSTSKGEQSPSLAAASQSLKPSLPTSSPKESRSEQEKEDQKMSLAGELSSHKEKTSPTVSPSPYACGKLPGTIILPCRARGMPVDHNFHTAHFVIPAGVGHGEDLICSYAKCRNSGVKFRFCASCRIPVAKRNFHQRHKHNMKVKSHHKRKPKAAEDQVANGSPTGEPLPPPPPKNDPLEIENTPKNQARNNDAPVPVSGAVSDSSADNISVVRQLRWASLLGQRPECDDDDMMSAWLLEVMAVSDRKIPVKQPQQGGSSSLTTSESSVNEPNATSSSDDRSLSSDDSSDDDHLKSSQHHPSRRSNSSPESSDRLWPKSRSRHLRDESGLGDDDDDDDEDPVVRESSEKKKYQMHKRKRSNEEKSKFRKVKKERNVDPSPVGDEGLSASYAEWRDRKKQRLLKKSRSRS